MNATDFAGSLVLFLLMMIVGLELSVADFRRVASAPRAVIGGTFGQLLLLPLMTWAVVATLDVPPVFGAGAVLVAASPGAGMSNIMVALARANLALSVTLTAVASVLAVVTLPVTAAIGVRFFLGDDVDVEISVGELVRQLLLVLLLPIGLGMALRARRPDFAAHYSKRLQRVLFATFLAFIALSIALGDQQEVALEDVRVGLVAATLWTLAAGAIGWGLATALDLSHADRFTFLIEFAARNMAVATMVAIAGLGRLDLTFFSVAYVMVGYPLIGAVTFLRRRYTTP
jgi:BASS family bile acid:Na+ symporter